MCQKQLIVSEVCRNLVAIFGSTHGQSIWFNNDVVGTFWIAVIKTRSGFHSWMQKICVGEVWAEAGSLPPDAGWRDLKQTDMLVFQAMRFWGLGARHDSAIGDLLSIIG